MTAGQLVNPGKILVSRGLAGKFHQEIFMNCIWRTKIMMFLGLSTMVLAACQTYPPPDFPELIAPLDAELVIKQFRKTWPQRATQFQVAVIEISGWPLTALGLSRFDAKNGEIALSLMSTTGVKLLEIMGPPNQQKIYFALPEITPEHQVGKQVGGDVRRIYLHPVEKADDCGFHRHRLTYGWTGREQRTELVFGGEKSDLKIKRIFSSNRLICRIYYYDYQEVAGFRLPARIRMENLEYDYNLTLKNRETASLE